MQAVRTYQDMWAHSVRIRPARRARSGHSGRMTMPKTRIADAVVYDIVESPLGRLLLLGDGESLCGLVMQRDEEPHVVPPGSRRSHDAFRAALVQLGEYFVGERRAFDLPLKLAGTPFTPATLAPRPLQVLVPLA